MTALLSKSPKSLTDLRSLLKNLPPPTEASGAAARARQAELTKPAGSLGRLEEIAEFFALWQGRGMPTLDRPLVLVFAGNHGVVAQGVSAYPPSVTQAMVDNFGAGGAAINQICKTFALDLKVVPLDLASMTEDFTQAAAMSEADTAAYFARGMASVPADADLVIVGEMGIGNTTSAAAIYTALFGGTPAHWAGRGTGVDDAGLKRKIAAVETACAVHSGHLDDPLEVLRRLGGREIAAMAGAITAARRASIPVLLDGYVACAAAAVLHAENPDATAHCLAGHQSVEGAHAEVLGRLGKKPLLDLGMRLGEASGAALAVGVVRAALACHSGMATFAEAQVAGKSEG
jgi:nicotinate-nucleotide--dimethylbenzimidazole phosphoribosyltransferase